MLSSDVGSELEMRNRDGASRIFGKTGKGEGGGRPEVRPAREAHGQPRSPVEAAAARRGGGGERNRHVRYVLRRPPPPPGQLGSPACPTHPWLRPRARDGGGGDGEREESLSSRLEPRSLVSPAGRPEGARPAPLRLAGGFRAQAAFLGCRPGGGTQPAGGA